MSTATHTTHEELRTRMKQGEFRAARGRDIAPYLSDVIPYAEMLSLVRLAVGNKVTQHADVVLAALDQIFAGEHDSLPLTNAYSDDVEDLYHREGAAWVLAKALLIDQEEDIRRLCAEAHRYNL